MGIQSHSLNKLFQGCILLAGRINNFPHAKLLIVSDQTMWGLSYEQVV